MQNVIKFTKGIFVKIRENITLNDVFIMLTGILSSMAILMYSKAPFGVACGIAYILNGYFPFSVTLPILGYALSGYDACTVVYIASLSVMGIFARKVKMSKLLLVFVYFFFSLTYTLIFGASIFNFVLLVLECVLIYVSSGFYVNFLEYFSGRTLRRTVSKGEVKSLLAVLLIVLIPLSRIYLPFDMTVAGTASAFVILFCALELDVSLCALCGCLLGTVMGLSNPQMIYCIGSYTISSVAASLGSKYRKTGAVLGFVIANALMTFFANGSKEILINIYEVICASAVIYLLPYSKLEIAGESVMMLLCGEKTKEIKRMELFKKETNGKLLKMSGAFTNLADVLGKFEKRRLKTPADDASMIIESVRDRVCLSCRNFDYCWKLEGDCTFKIMEKLILAVEKRGWVENYDLSARFKNSCYFSGKIVLETNKVYELYRVNRIWENKICESRQLISQQLKDVSDAVKGLAKGFADDCTYETGMENMAVSMLDMLGVKVTGVNIVCEKNGRIKAKVSVRDCGKNNMCERCVEPALSKVCNKKMKCVNKGCFGGNCVIELVEKETFKIENAVTRVRPGRENKCGDSYAIIRPDNERVIVALSDGMGTGDKAASESMETVNLLEKLLVAGIAEDTAIKLINSVLILKSYEESFATLDMLVFDLYTGMGEFVKTGGACSYIKRGNQVIKIKSDSLPTGIIGSVDPSSYRLSLTDGDIVLLLSDGVCDVSGSDEWLKNILRQSENENVKEISGKIISEAVKMAGEPVDDMTVLAVKIMFNN